jgi:hypothetical protein
VRCFAAFESPETICAGCDPFIVRLPSETAGKIHRLRRFRPKHRRMSNLDTARKMPILADEHFSSKEPLQSAGAKSQSE